jgi:hypothetical protein
MQAEINLTQITDKAVAAIVALPYRSNEYSYSGPSRLPRSKRSVHAIFEKIRKQLDAAGFSLRDRNQVISNIRDIAELEIRAEEAQ